MLYDVNPNSNNRQTDEAELQNPNPRHSACENYVERRTHRSDLGASISIQQGWNIQKDGSCDYIFSIFGSISESTTFASLNCANTDPASVSERSLR